MDTIYNTYDIHAHDADVKYILRVQTVFVLIDLKEMLTFLVHKNESYSIQDASFISIISLIGTPKN